MGSSLVQKQFGANAERYVRSRVHARGQSLQRMLALAEPQPHWVALDVAPGGGHSALAVAPYVRRMVALDLTWSMLQAARRYANEVGEQNVVWVQGDGARLPFAASRFDLLTCRIALHHFPDPASALHDWARVLKPGGRLVLVDNIGPEDAAACAYVNRFEKIRDPSHVGMQPFSRLLALVQDAGLQVQHSERLHKPMSFAAWLDRMQVSAADRVHLNTMLWQSTGAARAFLDPQGAGEATTFSLREGIIVATKPG